MPLTPKLEAKLNLLASQLTDLYHVIPEEAKDAQGKPLRDYVEKAQKALATVRENL